MFKTSEAQVFMASMTAIGLSRSSRSWFGTVVTLWLCGSCQNSDNVIWNWKAFNVPFVIIGLHSDFYCLELCSTTIHCMGAGPIILLLFQWLIDPKGFQRELHSPSEVLVAAWNKGIAEETKWEMKCEKANIEHCCCPRTNLTDHLLRLLLRSTLW